MSTLLFNRYRSARLPPRSVTLHLLSATKSFSYAEGKRRAGSRLSGKSSGIRTWCVLYYCSTIRYNSEAASPDGQDLSLHTISNIPRHQVQNHIAHDQLGLVLRMREIRWIEEYRERDAFLKQRVLTISHASQSQDHVYGDSHLKSQSQTLLSAASSWPDIALAVCVYSTAGTRPP